VVPSDPLSAPYAAAFGTAAFPTGLPVAERLKDHARADRILSIMDSQEAGGINTKAAVGGRAAPNEE
jgi:hypothetical protein